jgi:ABC-type amino acid transport substrate-binding protein
MSGLLRRIAAPALAALLLAACASTTVDGTWTRPEIAGQRIDGPVLVVGVARDETVRRVYEDDMVAKLAARGVRATRSYEVVPGPLDGEAHSRLLQAARNAGASYLLSTAVIGQEVETAVYQDPWPYPGYVGYRSWYGAYWGMAWPAYTQVRTYVVVIAQTSLARTDVDRVDWTARTRTTAPVRIESDVRTFVDVILKAMAKDGLVAAAT